MTTTETQQEHEYHIAERKSWGRKLLKAAWTVEIIAMLIGLMVAWSMGLQTYQAYTKDGVEFPIGKTFDLFLAALPFVMVAGVELLKIPFSYLIYINRNKKVKVTFSIVLVLVSVITFETLMTGFERQYANITTEVDIPRNKLAAIDNSINTKIKELKELKLFTIESINEKISARREQVEKNKNEDLKVLESSKKDYLASGNSDLTERKKSYQNDINIKIKKRDSEIKRLEKNSLALNEQELSNQKSIRLENNKQIRDLQTEKRENQNKIKGASWYNDTSDWKTRNQQIDLEISTLRQSNASQISSSAFDFKNESTKIYNTYEKEIDSLRQKISSINKRMAQNSRFKSEIANIEDRKQARRLKYSQELKEIDQFKNRELKRLELKVTRVDNLNAQLLPLRERKLALENEVIASYSTTQIYRIARTVYGVDRQQRITEKQISLVATVWFGSLAGIVSTMGIFLAFGAFVLSHPVTQFYGENQNKRRGNSLSISFRLMFRALRKRFKNPKIVTKIKEVEVPKEVIKEVPVDKVVFKEIPVEIVQKEVIHVPIYTNDPDLIKFGTTKVKDIIKDD